MKTLGAPGTEHTRQPEADRWVPQAGAPGPSQGRPGGLDPRRARAHGAAPSRAARRDGAGERRHGGRRAGAARGGAHGEKEVAASLTVGLDGGERRRMGSATSRGGGGPRQAAAALHGEAQGRVSAEIGRG